MSSSSIMPSNPPMDIVTYLMGLPNSSSVPHGQEPEWFDASSPIFMSAQYPHMTSFTFNQLQDLVKRLASRLQKEYLGPGDRLLVFTPPSIYTSILMLATIAAGGIFVACNSHLTTEQKAAIILESQPRLLLAHQSTYIETLQEIDWDALPTLRYVGFDESLFAYPVPQRGDINWGFQHSLLDLQGSQTFKWKQFQTDEDANSIATIIYTFDTNGNRISLHFSHKTFISSTTTTTTTTPSPTQQRWISNYTITHPTGLSIFLHALKTRTRLILYYYHAFHLLTYINTIRAHKITHCWATRQILDIIAHAKYCEGSEYPFLQQVCMGTGLVSRTLRGSVNEFFGKEVMGEEGDEGMEYGEDACAEGEVEGMGAEGGGEDSGAGRDWGDDEGMFPMDD